MSSFVLISAHKKFHPLIERIKQEAFKQKAIAQDESQHNAPLLKISYGELEEKEDAYWYEETLSYEETPSPEKLAGTSLEALVLNQLSHFKRDVINVDSSQNDSVLNVFVLVNPMDNHDYQEQKMMSDAFNELYSKGKGTFTHFKVYPICFLFDASFPEDVSLSIPQKYIEEYHNCSGNELKPSFILLDNKDLEGVAIYESKEDFYYKASNMLLDFMRLLSSTNSSYNLNNSINQSGGGTSLGYSSYIYNSSDYEKYVRISNKRDLLERIIHGEEDPSKFNIMIVEDAPLGLNQKEERLAKEFQTISLKEDVNLYPESAEKKINDAILKYQKIIEAYIIDQKRAETVAVVKHSFSDVASSIKQNLSDALPDDLQDSIEEFTEEEQDFSETPEKEESQEAESSEKDKLIYIDRKQIYEQWNLIKDDPFLKDEEKDEKIKSLQNQFDFMIKTLQSASFKKFLLSKKQEAEAKSVLSENSKQGTTSAKESNTSVKEITPPVEKSARKGCFFLSFLFHKNKESHDSNPISRFLLPDLSEFKSEAYIDFYEHIKSITSLPLKRAQFANFQAEIKKEKELLKEVEDQCKKFSISEMSLINLQQLKLYQSKNKEEWIQKIIENWKAEKEQTLTSLFNKAESFIQSNVKDYQSVNWANPFPFIKKFGPKEVENYIQNLLNNSKPFIQYIPGREQNEDRIYKHLFTDNESVVKMLDDKTVDIGINEVNKISQKFSSQTHSRICMMQFVKLDEVAWKEILSR